MRYKNNEQRSDVYQRVTDYVTDALERGEVPWQKRWNSHGLPRNITSGHHYRGWNVFFLNYVTLIHDYKTPYFITFKQTQASGGKIRKGEKGVPVIYWAVVEDKNAKKKKEAADETKSRTRLVPKMHIVFNIDQTEGLSFVIPELAPKSQHEKIANCERVIEQMPNCPTIRHGGDRAYYHRVWDEIVLPELDEFASAADYYNTKFHELGHSTGHRSRLNRKELMESSGFGTELYSKEELTAEFTAAYLSAITGIELTTIENSAAYISNWLSKLRDDKTLIIKASIQAQAAADYILGTDHQQPEAIPTTSPAIEPISPNLKNFSKDAITNNHHE